MEREAWERCTDASLIPWAGAAIPKPSLPTGPHWNPNAPFISAAPQLYQREMLCGSQSKLIGFCVSVVSRVGRRQGLVQCF